MNRTFTICGSRQRVQKFCRAKTQRTAKHAKALRPLRFFASLRGVFRLPSRTLLQILARENAINGCLLLLAAVTSMGGGCRVLVKMQQSVFLSRFMLDRSVKAIAYKGIDSTRGPGGGGGMGGSAGGIGPGGAHVKSSSTSTAGFTINLEGENKFKESEFMEALAAQIKREIEESHASITGTGSASPNGFFVDYKDGNIHGRITISGSATGQVYAAQANVDESNKP
jgi:hypothetical protein